MSERAANLKTRDLNAPQAGGDHGPGRRPTRGNTIRQRLASNLACTRAQSFTYENLRFTYVSLDSQNGISAHTFLNFGRSQKCATYGYLRLLTVSFAAHFAHALSFDVERIIHERLS